MSATTTTTTDAQVAFRRPSGGRTVKNGLATVYVFLATALAIIPLAWVLYTVITKGIRLLLSSEWWLQSQRGITPRREGGGAYHAIVGTVEMALICAAIAVPLGILGAIFLIEYAKGTKVARAVSFMVDILSGIPSIVAALFIYALFITIFGLGRSAIAVSFALVLLMLPVVLRSTEEMLKLVPNELREASYALGVPKWKTIVRVVIPTAFAGIMTGVMLGLARVMGETAPLLILVSYAVGINFSPTSDTMGALPTMINAGRDQAPTAAWLRTSVGRCPDPDPDLDVAQPAGARHRPGQQAEGEITMARRIDVRNLDIYYGGFHAVEDVSMTVEPRTVTAFIGPSGCGKSTLLRTLNRMHEVIPGAHVKGSVQLDGTELYGQGVDPVAVRRVVGMVFQRPNPFPSMSIYDNVAAGLRLNGVKNKKILDDAVERSLMSANLWNEVKDRLGKAGIGLSGGQQQRLCIARAIAVEPQVILMDEPCSALDPISTLAIEDLIGAAPGAVHRRDRHAQHAAGCSGQRPDRVLQPRRPGKAGQAHRDRSDREDLLQPGPEGDRGLHHRKVRLRRVPHSVRLVTTSFVHMGLTPSAHRLCP